MPATRNALIRYKTIDRCLKNRAKKWTLDTLIGACSDALYEYEGITKGISRRTIQLDIQNMRSDKLGYNAPIIVVEKKYYTYSDPEYSITNTPISLNDLFLLKDIVSTLEQFSSFSHFFEFGDIIKKLEDQLSVKTYKRKPIISFDRNLYLKGLDFVDICYKAIAERNCLEIEYQSFKARQPSKFKFHPQFLKEFNNRWFLVGVRSRGESILPLALDRMVSIETLKKARYVDLNIDPDEYYKNIVGVSVNKNQRPRWVEFYVRKKDAPYVKTKPIHPTQVIIEDRKDGTVFRIHVVPNHELESRFLSFGPRLIVLSPATLRKRIKNLTKWSLDHYTLNMVDEE